MDFKVISEVLRTGNVAELKRIMSFVTNGYQVYNPFVNPIGVEPGSTTDSKIQAMKYEPSMFQGKTVSDLGCNLGVFSLLALDYGASKVIGYELEENFKKFCEAIKNEHELRFPQHQGKAKIIQGNLNKLPKIEKTDVLLVHSIIHWFFVFNRKVTMEDIAKWLHSSCNEAVYFEGCITAQEPVMKKYGVDVQRFNDKVFFEEVEKLFTVEMIGRPSYNKQRIVARLYKK